LATRSPDFGPLARTYDELRPPDENWWEVFDVLIREGDLVGRRVLEVGCGTGVLAAALAERGASVWAVDPSPEMLAVARDRVPRGVGVKLGQAEALPFRDAWFDRVVARLVVHLVDRPSAFGEMRRVLSPDGRAALATFDPSHFSDFWLNRLFPSLEAIDRARFPTGDDLERELSAAGFADVRLIRLSQRAERSRDDAVRRIRGRWISTLHLLDEDEFRAGLERAERELGERVEYAIEWLIAVAG
jgi:ubiquinone/menaquinone biosynthesis C-methylase UbiE